MMERKETSKELAEFWKTVEFNRYGILFIGILIQSCIASVAVAFVCSNLSVEEQTVPLIFLSVTTMAANAANIALAPMKWVVGLFVAVVVVSMTVLIYTVL